MNNDDIKALDDWQKERLVCRLRDLRFGERRLMQLAIDDLIRTVKPDADLRPNADIKAGA